ERAFENRATPLPETEKGMVSEVFIPQEAADPDQEQLHHVHQRRSLVPTTDVRELSTRSNPLKEEERQRHDAYQRSREELFKKLRGHVVDSLDAYRRRCAPSNDASP